MIRVASAAERIEAARAFLATLPAGRRPMVVGATRAAADHLVRRVTRTAGTTLEVHRASLTQRAARMPVAELAPARRRARPFRPGGALSRFRTRPRLRVTDQKTDGNYGLAVEQILGQPVIESRLSSCTRTGESVERVVAMKDAAGRRGFEVLDLIDRAIAPATDAARALADLDALRSRA